MPCLIYVSCNDEILIYYDLQLRSIPCNTLINVMSQHINDYYSLKEDQHSLGNFAHSYADIHLMEYRMDSKRTSVLVSFVFVHRF